MRPRQPQKFWIVFLLFGGNKTDSVQLSPVNATKSNGGQMTDKNKDLIDQKLQDLNNDGVDRRGFLKCMAWAGTGLVWTMSGGIPTSRAFAITNGKMQPRAETSALSRSAT